MITAFRRYLDTWVVRGFFLIMVLSFVLWGVGDVVRLIGHSTWVAKVGGQTIEAQTLQGEYQRALNAATRDLPPGQEATAELRHRVGEQTLQQLIGQAAMQAELHRLRIVAPDAAVAAIAHDMPAFRGSDGKFSKAVFDGVLRNNGLTEQHFLEMMRGDLAQRQLLGAVSAGAVAPRGEIDPLYTAEFEKRSADMVELPFSASPAPPAPDEAVLQRWYDNHPDSYATPEYRRIKAIELSPQTLAKEITITDADLHAAYDQHRADYVTEAKRSAQVISAPDEATAKTLADKWRGGADWAAMQAAAQAAGASAVEQTDAPAVQYPDPDLAHAVFAAAADTVSDPIKGRLGWFVIKVTKITVGGTTSFEQAKESLGKRVLADKAADLMYDRANKIDDLLANGTSFDALPGDQGLAAIAGTMDAQGDTMDGTKAPIPGPAELQAAIVKAALQTQKGDPPRLVEVQTPSAGGSAYYALTVEDVTPPGVKPFAAVRDKVATDWIFDQQRHAQDEAAAKMLTAVNGGQSLTDAATVAGVQPRMTPLVTRGQGAEGMPPELQRVLFGLKKGEATMVETADGFIVAVVAEIVEPDPKADAAGYDQVRTAITRSIAGDLTNVFGDAIRQRANPRIDQQNLNQIIQP
ncbi:MAG TPA: peptidyl-prolyl cis-trans isomerase [Acetobacteraceae bacterium]